MTRGLNKVMLIGRVGAQPELRHTPGGQPVTSFRLATTRTWMSTQGDHKEETAWFTIVAWDKLAGVCAEFLQKGRQIYIEGRLQNKEWTGKDGLQHMQVEIVAREMLLLGGGAAGNADVDQLEQPASMDAGDEFPF